MNDASPLCAIRQFDPIHAAVYKDMKYKLCIIIVLFFPSLFLVSCANRDLSTATAIPTREVRSPAPSATGSDKGYETPTPEGAGMVGETESPVGARASLRWRRTQGSLIEVEILLQNVVDLYGVEVHLAFDPAVVNVKDADKETTGVQVDPSQVFVDSGFVALNKVDNDEGIIDFAATLVNPAKPLRGEVKVASFLLQGLKEGSTDITFRQILLADSKANALSVVSEGITIEIRP